MNRAASWCRLLAVFLVGVAGCKPAPPGDAPAQSIAVVGELPNGLYCMAVADSGLAVGDQIKVASVPLERSGSSQSGVMAVTERFPGACVGLWGSHGDVDYLVAPSDGWVPAYDIGPGVALVGGPRVVAIDSAGTQADLDGDGSLETFRACTSHEGIHLTLWLGEPLQSVRVWHGYFFLGYEVEPSCVPADYESQ
jgi:hypothetical protein